MDDFELLQPLRTHDRFKIFEAFAKKLNYPVVLKQCAYKTDADAEFFIRSALIKTHKRVYSQPLLFIFASAEKNSRQSFINFVWKRGEELDIEVESDRESQFPSGKGGLERQKTVFTNPHSGVSVKKKGCLTLGKDVICKIFKYDQILDMNNVFKEALAQARCNHPNICDFHDFRMYKGKKYNHCAYIVMEWLEQDLDTELRKRVPSHQLYDELELISILEDVTAGLLHAKSQGLAHNDIKPSNILRGPQGLKLADFGSAWLKGQYSTTYNAAGTEVYISPEALETMANTENPQRPFISNIFSLGMTMLHLAAMEQPERTPAMNHSEQQVFLQQKVQELKYSEELKRLLTGMLSIAPGDRPPLETVQTEAERIHGQETQRLDQKALRLQLQARSKIDEGKNSEAIELVAASHAIFSQLPKDKNTAKKIRDLEYMLYEIESKIEAVEMYASTDSILSRLPENKGTANYLRVWGDVLCEMGRKAEAVEKYSAAHSILSRLPDYKKTAYYLRDWGDVLYKMERKAEAVEMYASTDSILSRLPENKGTANYLRVWGDVLCEMGRKAEAVEKYAAAHSILSRLPENIDTAKNLRVWGDVLYEMGREAEAVEKYAAAHFILSRLPEHKNTANYLRDWGVLLYRKGRKAEAVEKYAAAHSILSRLPDDKNTAKNLRVWGDVLYEMGREAVAVEKYATAHFILSRLPENIDTAKNLRVWGDVLYKLGRKAEAVEKYAAAHSILSRLPDDKNTAKNLRVWGDVFYEMGRKAEAVEKYAAAHSILSRLPENIDTAKNLRVWGDVLYEMRREAEAVEKYAAAHTILSRLPKDQDTAFSLRQLGVSLMRQGAEAEAVACFQNASNIYSSLGETDLAEDCKMKARLSLCNLL